MKPKPSASHSAHGFKSSSAFLRAAGLLIVLVILAWANPFAGRSLAQPVFPQTYIAVVDYQRILRDSNAAQNIRNQVEKRRATYQQQILVSERQLHEKDKELARQRSVLAPDVYAERRQAFELEVADIQRLVQERRRELDDTSAQAFSVVRNKIIEIVGELSKKHQFNLVLPSSEVLMFAPELDLTEEVMTSLNAQLPTVSIGEFIDR